jgi:hypothetical protein
MATNEILPFASTNTGTNLLTQAEYTSDAQRSIGHQPGIARSKLENKVLRQASLMAAGLAEFIADYQANNVTDSLTTQNIADYLYAAILNVSPIVPDATTSVKGKAQLATNAETQTGTDSAKIVTPAALASLTATDIRRGLIEIATAAEVGALTDGTRAVTPLRLPDAFPGSFNIGSAGNGWIRLPSGLVIQWGSSNNVGQHTGVTFPIAFINQPLQVQINHPVNFYPVPGNWYHIRPTYNDRFGFWHQALRINNTIETGGGVYIANWLAIGY